jgi:hypothetical protein
VEYAVRNPSQTDWILAVLEGGPVSLPEASRTQLVEPLAQKIKVPFCGGYEHFERISPVKDNSTQTVFRWTMRTAVAE